MANLNSSHESAGHLMNSSDASNAPGRFRLANRKQLSVRLLTGEDLLLLYDSQTLLDEIFKETCKCCGLGETDYFGLAIKTGDWYYFVDLSKRVSKYTTSKFFGKHATSTSRASGGADRSRSGPDALLTITRGTDPAAVASAALEHSTPIPRFHFRVQFYVDFTCLRDHSAKHLYYLQMRENLREYRLLQSEEQVIQLVLYALQADFGPYSDQLLLGTSTPDVRRPPRRSAADTAALNGFDLSAYSSSRQHTQNLKDTYFDPAKYFPQWVLEKLGSRYLREQLPGLHRSLGPLSASEAEFTFVRECSQYPVSHAMHLFRTLEPFRRPPRGGSGRSLGNTSASSSNSSFPNGGLNATGGSANSSSSRTAFDSRYLCVGISGKGIELFEEVEGGFKLYVSTIPWSNIAKLSFKKNRFEIRPTEMPTKSMNRSTMNLSSGCVDATYAPQSEYSLQSSNSLYTSQALLSSSGGTRTKERLRRPLLFQLPDERVCSHILYLSQNTHISQTRALLRAPRTQSAVEMAERRKYRESLIYSSPDELQRVAQYAVPEAVGARAPAYNVAPLPEGSISLLAPTERSLDRCPPGTRTNTGFGIYDQPTSTSSISPGSVFTQDASNASGPGSRLGISPNSGIAIEISSHRRNSRPSPINPQQQQQQQQLQQQQQKPFQPSAVGALSISDVSSASNATTTPSVSLPTSPPTTSPSTSATSPATSPSEPPSSRTVVLASVNSEPSALATALLNSDGSYVANVPPPHIGGGGGGLTKMGAQKQQQPPAPPRSSPPQSPAARNSMMSSQSSDSCEEGNYVLDDAALKPPVAPTQIASGRPLQQEGAYVNAVIVGGRVQQQQKQQSLDVFFSKAPLQNSAAPDTVKVSTQRSLAASADSSQQNNNSGPLHPEVQKIYEMAKGSQSSTLTQNAPLLASLCTDSSLLHISGGNVGTPQLPPLQSRPSEGQSTSTFSIPRAALAPPAPNAAAGGHYMKRNKPSPLRPSPAPVRRPVYSPDGEASGVDVMENDLPSPSGAGSGAGGGGGGGGMRSWRSLGADLNFASTGHESPPEEEPGVAHMQPLQTATSASNLAVRNGAGGEAIPRIPRAAIGTPTGNNKAQMQFAFTPTTVSPAGVRSPSSAFPLAPALQGALYSGQSTAAGPQFYSRTPQSLAAQNPWPPYVAPQALPQNA